MGAANEDNDNAALMPDVTPEAQSPLPATDDDDDDE